MKYLTAILPIFCATFVGSSALFTRESQDILNANFPVAGDSPLEYCADPAHYLVEDVVVDLSPNPPEAGKNLTISVSGKLKKDVGEGAKVLLKVKYNKYITLINQVADLCDNLPKIDLECPLDAGEIKVFREVALPKIIPIGQYEVFAQALTEDQEEIVCMETLVHFPPRRSA